MEKKLDILKVYGLPHYYAVYKNEMTYLYFDEREDEEIISKPIQTEKELSMYCENVAIFGKEEDANCYLDGICRVFTDVDLYDSALNMVYCIQGTFDNFRGKNVYCVNHHTELDDVELPMVFDLHEDGNWTDDKDFSSLSEIHYLFRLASCPQSFITQASCWWYRDEDYSESKEYGAKEELKLRLQDELKNTLKHVKNLSKKQKADIYKLVGIVKEQEQVIKSIEEGRNKFQPAN